MTTPVGLTAIFLITVFLQSSMALGRVYSPWIVSEHTADTSSMEAFRLDPRWKDKRGQDLIEYALMAGFVAVAAGAIMPNVASSISTIFDAISTHLEAAASQGGS